MKKLVFSAIFVMAMTMSATFAFGQNQDDRGGGYDIIVTAVIPPDMYIEYLTATITTYKPNGAVSEGPYSVTTGNWISINAYKFHPLTFSNTGANHAEICVTGWGYLSTKEYASEVATIDIYEDGRDYYPTINLRNGRANCLGDAFIIAPYDPPPPALTE